MKWHWAAVLGLCAVCALSPTLRARAPRLSDVSSIYGAAVRGRDIVRRAIREYEGSQPLSTPTVVDCRGRARYFGHLPKPDEAIEQEVADRIAYLGDSRKLTYEGSRKSAGGELWKAHAVAEGRRVVAEDFSDDKPYERSGHDAALLRWKISVAQPLALLKDVLDQEGSVLWVGRSEDADVVSYTDTAHQLHALSIDSRTHLLLRVETVIDERTWGDTAEIISYPAHRWSKGRPMPARIERQELGRNVYEVSCTDSAEVPAAQPDAAAPARVDAGLAEPNRVRVIPLSSGVYAVRVDPGDYPAMFIDTPQYVMVLEAPGDAAAAEAMLDVIAKTIPGKPVKYLAISHHHPDYVSAMRPFVARGATLVTTPGNVDYLRRIARAPHRLRPDALSRSPRDVSFERVVKRATFGEQDRTIEVYDVGPYSEHVAEALLYYLPHQKLVFEAEMLRFPPGGARAGQLLRAIRELGLTVERVYPSLSGASSAEQSLEELTKLAAAPTR